MDDPNRLIQKQFGAHANNYVTSQVHAQGPSLARLVELTQPQKDWVVLDISTGAGHTALAFAPHVARVLATDLPPQMLDAARQLATERAITNIEFKPADAHALPFGENTYDLVTNRLALHHFTDARQAMGPQPVLLGNIDPVRMVKNSTPAAIQAALAQCHRDAGERYIVGAGCEIPRNTPRENLQALTEYAHSTAR